MGTTTPNKVRITVLKKTFNKDFVEAYTEGHDFEEGQEFITEGQMPEGFSDWA